jgi:hypothetical protein
VTKTFADAARRCCALSARLPGWRPADFWLSTPAELAMAIADPNAATSLYPPDRMTIARMMERDADG